MNPEQDISTERYYHGVDMIAMLAYIFRRAYWIVLTAVIGAAIARFYVTRYTTPLYQATSKLYLAGSDSIISVKDLDLGSSLTKDFQETFKTWRIYEMVKDRLGVDYSYETLTEMVSTSNPSGSHLLYITVTAPKPEETQLLADAYAEAGQDYIENVLKMRRPQLFEKARKPSEPVLPDVKRSTRNGAVVGGLIPAIMFMLFFLLDDRIRSGEDIVNTVHLPVLGSVPLQSIKQARAVEETKDFSASKDMPQAIIRGGLSLDRAGVESIDAICTDIFFAGHKLKTISITSCRQKERKTLVAMQLSLSMARRGKKTLLIDCDLRSSTMRGEGLILLSGSSVGLAHLLSGQCDLSDAVYATNVSNLFLLPGGENASAPLALISSSDFDDLLKHLGHDYDMILIDTPPVGNVIDAAEIARRCDGSLIVVEDKKTSKRMLKEAVDRLQKTKTPILGCILDKGRMDRKKSK